MGWKTNKNGDVLRGPKTPLWCCGCGEDANWASRLRCRTCGRDAPARIRASAQKADKEAKLVPKGSPQPMPQGKWASGAPESGRFQKLEARLKTLEAENKLLRDASKVSSTDVVELDDDADDLACAVGRNPKLVQEVLDATIKAYGAESTEAKEKAAELESLRETHRLAKPVSVQLRAAERRIDRQRKSVEKAKADAIAAGEAVRAAQTASTEADSKLAKLEKQLQETEAERTAIISRKSGSPGAESVRGQDCCAALDALLTSFRGDAEAAQALNLLRGKMGSKGEPSLSAAVETDDFPMDLDEEAIDKLADLITGDAANDERPEQRNARLEASKARLKLVRKDVATQLVGVRKRIKK